MIRLSLFRRRPARASREGKTPVDDRPRREQGVALVLTLAVLALLLILGMSFSFQSRTSLMESEVNADIVRARLLAESALQRCTAYLEYNYKGIDQTGWTAAHMYPATVAPGLFFDGPAGTPWAGRKYAVSMAGTPDNAGIETALAVDFGTPTVDFPFTPDWQTQVSGNALHPNAGWHHVLGPEVYTDTNGNGQWDAGEPLVDANGNGTWDANGAVIGRLAFLVTDESGKLDPTWCVSFYEPFVDEPYTDTNKNGRYDGGEPFTDLNGNSTHDTILYWDLDGNNTYTNTAVNEGAERRFGGRPQEIDLEYALPASIRGVRDGWRTLIPVVNGYPAQWLSWYHIFARAFGGAASAVNDARVCTQTLFPFSYDIEAFHTGTDANTLNNEYHRFDLVRAPWNLSSPNKPTVASLAVASPPAGQRFWDTSVTPPVINASLPADGGAIPWLAQIKAEDGTTSLSNQVAANLIDYCDSDNAATSDYPTNGTPAPPGGTAKPDATYVGLEKAPYINEIQIAANVQDAITTPPPNDWDMVITVSIELINIYDVNLGPVTVSFIADFKGPSGNNGKNQTGSQSIAVPANSYAVAAITLPVIHDNAAPPIPFNLEDIEVEVRDGSGNLLDFTRLNRTACTVWPPDKPLTVLPAPALVTTSNSLEVYDPRANTGGFNVDATNGTTGDWAWNQGAWSNGIGAGTVGSRNTNSDPSSPGGGWAADAETVNDPAAGMSTAFIRNAPPLSLWELGCIHRGERWRTLNLRAYNDGSNPGTYGNGDAAILDQVKLGDMAVTHGKVNANSPTAAVWQALFDHITTGAKYDDPGGTGTALSTAQIANLANAVIAGNVPAWDARGAITTVSALHDGSIVPQTNDRSQEEIIGKIANLLTVRQNFFTVIITGQAVQDIGALPAGVTAPEDAVEYDSTNHRFVRILATQKVAAVLYRDAFTNRYRVVRYEFLEE